MRLPQNSRQRTKAGIHCAQFLFIFITGCLTLAVVTKDGGHGGQTNFYFALCFFSLPAIIFQVMVPLWSRAWRFNSVWAYASIDILFALFWFAASVAVGVWNAHGVAMGKSIVDHPDKDQKANTRRADEHLKKDGTCASFAFGSASKCSVSKATVGLGIIIFLLFCATAAISILAIKQYRKDGTLPNNHLRQGKETIVIPPEDEAKDIWSTNTAELNPEDDRLAYGQMMDGDEQGLLAGDRTRVNSDPHAHGMVHPGRRTSYHSPSQMASMPSVYDDRYAPSALSPTTFVGSLNGRVQFPEANYNSLR